MQLLYLSCVIVVHVVVVDLLAHSSTYLLLSFLYLYIFSTYSTCFYLVFLDIALHVLLYTSSILLYLQYSKI